MLDINMLENELSGHMNNIKMHWEITEIMVRKNDNVIFHQHFLNIDISLPTSYKPFTFSKCILEIQRQGIVSQNVDLGSSHNVMKCRNLNTKK